MRNSSSDGSIANQSILPRPSLLEAIAAALVGRDEPTDDEGREAFSCAV